MQEMNYIHLSWPDYRAISGSAMITTFPPGAVEHNLSHVGENVEAIAEDLIDFQL
jgi:hypothetical protein